MVSLWITDTRWQVSLYQYKCKRTWYHCTPTKEQDDLLSLYTSGIARWHGVTVHQWTWKLFLLVPTSLPFPSKLWSMQTCQLQGTVNWSSSARLENCSLPYCNDDSIHWHIWVYKYINCTPTVIGKWTSMQIKWFNKNRVLADCFNDVSCNKCVPYAQISNNFGSKRLQGSLQDTISTSDGVVQGLGYKKTMKVLWYSKTKENYGPGPRTILLVCLWKQAML